MKKALILPMVMASTIALAEDVLIKFDSGTSFGSVLNGYNGFNWNNFLFLDGLNFPGNPSGYLYGVVSANNVVWNSGADPAYFSSDSAFNLKSAYLTGAWNDDLQVTVKGYNGETLVRTRTYTLSATAPTKVTFNWANLTRVRFESAGGTKHSGYSGNGTHFAMDDLLISYGLLLGPDPLSTIDSMERNASAVRSVFALQASYLNPGLSNDCAVFEKNGWCVAVSGRTSKSSGSDGAGVISGAVAASYRVDANTRIGGFIEQNLSDVSTGGVTLDNSSPDFGVFGVWQQTQTGEGVKLRAAYRYGKKNVTITRDAVDGAEPGSGVSDLVSQGAQFTLSNGYRLDAKTLATPYFGLRYTDITRDGYTEAETDLVTTSLTYSDLELKTFSALAGVGLAFTVDPNLTLNGSFGLEADLRQNISDYSATGIDGLGSIDMSNDSRRIRGVVGAGATYKIDQMHQLSGQLLVRQEAFRPIATTTAMITYTAGF